ncbi:SGNH/GDSL hydrolase family protein [Sphingomonas sp. PB2P12]|uniref:SGNH/GDSL hydrolase family protein n=1 Tax=Sphingomonas sandaracina TaxID=3096157 RepID=UPI002FC82002
MKKLLGMLGAAMLSTSAISTPLSVTPVSIKPGAPLPVHIAGRVDRTGNGYRRQWPGTYFEATFLGVGVLLKVGEGDVILRVSVDGSTTGTLVKPKPGLYRVADLANGRHTIRVDVASESQAAPTVFGGFYATAGTRALPAPTRTRQIEFIGDSHTVGYGNISTKRDCTQDEVWTTTDASQAMPALTARRYGADYQVNAISGRGIVRNYDGMAADTVPVAYPFILFDKTTRYTDTAWRPRLYVIALGTNDFTTPLHPGEPWKTRAALHADYEQHYVDFVKRLRAANPDAHVVLWATDMADGEIAAEVGKVAARLKAEGERNVAFVRVTDLAFTGCHAHPSTSDDARITTALSTYIDTHPEIWMRK